MIEADFNIPASDTKGHNERLWARIPPGMADQINTVMESRQFPYRSKGSLIRHALMSHLEWLEGQSPIPSVMRQVDAIADIMREDEFSSDFLATFGKLSEQVSRHLASGRIQQARELIRKVVSKVELMPDDSDWREIYLKELESQFGHMLAGSIARLT